MQRDHIHLYIETRDKLQLARGMQSFCISLAMSLKKLTSYKERGIFKDRYFVHILKTLREVKNTIHYICKNGFKHKMVATHADTFCSAVLFKSFKHNFSFYFKTNDQMQYFKEKIKEIVDPAKFWLSF